MNTFQKIKIKKRYRWIVIPLVIIVLLLAAGHEYFNRQEEVRHDALGKIRKRGQLIALTDKNSLGYFIYKGEPMGYQLELLQSFADYLGVSLKIICMDDVSRMYRYMDYEAADLIALNIPESYSGKMKAHFSKPLNETRFMLVQRKLYSSKEKKGLVRDLRDLSGDTVYIRKNFFVPYVLNTFFRKTSGVTLVEDPSHNPEELARMVSEGKIRYTIVEENLAMVLMRAYPNLDAIFPVTSLLKYSWCVTHASDSLLFEINKWMDQEKKEGDLKDIYLSYFDNPKIPEYFKNDYCTLKSKKLSPYDESIRKGSRMIWWDWRLLGSIVYEESNFHSGRVSSRNARGLMQLMPQTALKFGVDSGSSPTRQILAGIKYLRWLDTQLPEEIKDPRQRVFFTLAAYNVGLARVLTARQKAVKYGQDPNKWDDNVSFYLTRKSRKDPYAVNDTLADTSPFGESGGFVDRIISRYYHYRNLLPQ
ncbi:MAG: transglycosylase SLT domain-containing protein [Bacteroidota bacterium]|nr:transglycosylase SLT domain-containing protein [Bacteroidota bacterium]